MWKLLQEGKKLRGEWLPSAVVLLEQGDAEAQRGGCCFREVSAAGGGDRGVKTTFPRWQVRSSAPSAC